MTASMADRPAARRRVATAPSETGAAGWLAEALVTGNPLAPLPEALAPRTVRGGERLALAVLEEAGLTACGVRVAPGPGGGGRRPVAGPMIESRLLPDGASIALPTLRHVVATAAVVGVLARDLPPLRRGVPEDAPEFSALHPAIDVGASRFRDPPRTAALLAADLGGLGFVVAGRGAAVPPDGGGGVPVVLEPAGGPGRPRGRRGGGTSAAEAAPVVDLLAALVPAAAAARRLGGLPAGAILVAAGLSSPITPEPGMLLRARFGPGFGRVTVTFA